MNCTDRIRAAQTAHQSLLCVGLDPDPARLPLHWRGDASKVFDFCAAVADATAQYACCFKPQIAYFAAIGAERQLERLMQHLRDTHPSLPIILDAKRGDIGDTAKLYAQEAFERYGADAVTLSPYMGFDTITPYLQYADKAVFVLCRTSNAGGDDLQALAVSGKTVAAPAVASGLAGDGVDVSTRSQAVGAATESPKLYEHIARLAATDWAAHSSYAGQIGLVVGATYPAELARVRQIAPNVPLLIPGVGAQGGDAAATVQAATAHAAQGLNIVNSSRAILYASSGADFAQAAAAAAKATRAALQVC